MSNACLLDFTPEADKLKHYTFTSDWIKQFDECSAELFEWKAHLQIIRKNIQKKKESKLVYYVCEDTEWKGGDGLGGGDTPNPSEQEAINCFLNRVDELKCLAEKTKQNIVFDGRRYFLKLDENDNVIGREI